jgi:hypothetical protein
MTSMLATESAEKPPARTLLETWGKNERMRHVPPVEWIVRKLDVDLRRRIDLASAVFTAMSVADPRRAKMESELRALCRAIDRLSDAGKHTRTPNDQHPPSDLGGRVSSAVTHAVSNLNSLDPNLFGRRYPFQTFERSRAEPVMAALLVVICVLTRVASLAREIDPSVDERVLAGLVTLQQPLREQPIA